jgi:small subunit ribosomal protein S17
MRRRVVGRVTSESMQKTIRVSVPRRVKDSVTGKFVSRETVCLAHDEKGEARLLDIVELVESRPISKRKRWELVRVVSSESSR